MLQCGMVWYGIVWYGIILYGTVWYAIRYGLVSGIVNDYPPKWRRLAVDIRDLTQLRRGRRQRRLLKFELPVFPFLVCVTHSFLFYFA